MEADVREVAEGDEAGDVPEGGVCVKMVVWRPEKSVKLTWW